MCCLTMIIGLLLQSFSVVAAAIIALVVVIYSAKTVWKSLFCEESAISDEYEPEWYGKEPQPVSNEEDTSIKEFRISVGDEVLEDLKNRLERTRFEDPVIDSKFLYGFNKNYLKKVVNYWKKDYDWRKQEAMLNQYHHYTTRIEGINVHFLHVKPNLPKGSELKVLPLLLIHGWPGSIVEFYKIIPLLTTPRPETNFVFEVICPSIPGYGFSESPHRKGFTCRSAARVFITLMNRLGFQNFYVQGGDWGSIISKCMARYYPSRILGVHLNMFSTGFKLWDGIKLLSLLCLPFLKNEEEIVTVRIWKRHFKNLFEEMGYAHIQSTKPDTIGSAMCDSPAGMAAYILEKFCYWTNPEYINLDDGGITEKYSLDDLLTNVTIYWVNNNFTASVRFYKENLMPVFKKQYEKYPIVVPTAVAVFPNELTTTPKSCTSQQIKNLVSFNIMERGGHFAAFEEPELLANDIWKFISIIY